MDEELEKALKEEPFQEVGKIFISSVRCQKHYSATKLNTTRYLRHYF